jgi:molybdenum cofactor synthesis domain-containing protein
MISLQRAQKIIKRETPRLGTQRIALENAIGRVTAAAVKADSDTPPFDRSQMDGYAVIASDTAAVPVTLEVIGESSAGCGFDGRVRRGQAVRIMTGARLPKGADAVQRLEATIEEDSKVTILQPAERGKFVVSRGSEAKRGQTCLAGGVRLTPWNIAIPASFGLRKIEVYKRPRVAIIPTGNEIVPIGSKPPRDKIRDSNSVMLAAFCEDAGALPKVFPIAGDNDKELLAAIKSAAKASDMIITTGGVSVGKYDLTRAAFEKSGADILFDRIRLKPGKPVVFARKRKLIYFGLPGNPVSAAVSFFLLVRPALLLMQGLKSFAPSPAFGVAAAHFKATQGRDCYLPAIVEFTEDGLLAKPIGWKGSSDFISLAKANALARVPAGVNIEAGNKLELYFL